MPPNLVPVNHDPFTPLQLVPVEHDPFNALAAAGSPPSGPLPGESMLRGAVDWWNSQPSWLERAAAVHAQSNPGTLRPTPAEIDFGTDVAGSFGLSAGGNGIKAFHGSPYDFDRFDIGKIGTGEGAQAYGHGLYFAEEPGVAEQYKQALAAKSTAINRAQLAKDAAADLGSSSKYLPEAVLKQLEAGTPADQVWSKVATDPIFRGRSPQEINDAVDYVLQKFPEHKANPGKMYEVNIAADPSHFLDWDKPLSEQHPKVQEALGGLEQNIKSGWLPTLKNELQSIRQDQFRNAKTGQEAISALERGTDKSQAASILRDAGIPGIKYLDQGSRGSGQGTYNYVVFDDKLIDIIKKYGLAGLIAGGAAHFSTQPVEHDPFQ